MLKKEKKKRKKKKKLDLGCLQLLVVMVILCPVAAGIQIGDVIKSTVPANRKLPRRPFLFLFFFLLFLSFSFSFQVVHK